LSLLPPDIIGTGIDAKSNQKDQGQPDPLRAFVQSNATTYSKMHLLFEFYFVQNLSKTEAKQPFFD
jgi:hypothetical protein